MLILGADDDKFSLNTEDIFEYALDAFINGTFERQIYPGKHAFTKEMRGRAYKFLDEHLNL